MEEKKFKRTTVTAALPYANGGVHIGHLAGVYVPADIYARYLRLKKEDVVFIGGSDEHGVPITLRAKKEGITPQAVCDRYHKLIKESFKEFGISFDIYSRTTSETHHKFASDFFRKLYDDGKLIEKESEQFMSLTAGIVGLPNVGKSTLFNAITKAGAEMANYPFATIDPNVGMVEVPDSRLDRIQELIPAKKIVPTTFEFTDIAGIVKGASKGEGLGNKFLENIRQTDAIVHVVRAFDDNDITSVSGKVDPIEDIDTINLELVMADLDAVNKRLAKVQRAAKGRDKDALAELEVLNKIKPVLEDGKGVRSIDFSDDEQKIVKGLFLLTSKPVLYVANIAEEDMADPDSNKYMDAIKEHVKDDGEVIGVAAAAEEQIAEMDEADKADFLEMEGVTEPGLNRLIRAAYKLLGLETFFTAGGPETRAWTYKKGTKAPQAAGIIHSDFERGFIRAEVMSFEDLDELGSESAVKEAGKLRLEGKDYVMQDGDIVEFRFNV